MKPEFADNREITLADALNAHLDWLAVAQKEPVEMSIATGYFDAEGFTITAGAPMAPPQDNSWSNFARK